MAFQPAVAVVQVNIRYLRDNQQIENVLHVQVAHTVTPTDLEAIAGAVQVQVSSIWMPLMPANILFQEVQTIDLTVEGGEQFVLAVIPAQAGGVGGIALPNNVSMAFRLKAATGGRHGAGRLYWPGFAVSQVASTNTLSATALSDIITAIQELIDALQTLGYIVSILSRYFNNVRRSPAITFGVQSVSVADNVFDSQRRRLPGRGV